MQRAGNSIEFPAPNFHSNGAWALKIRMCLNLDRGRAHTCTVPETGRAGKQAERHDGE